MTAARGKSTKTSGGAYVYTASTGAVYFSMRPLVRTAPSYFHKMHKNRTVFAQGSENATEKRKTTNIEKQQFPGGSSSAKFLTQQAKKRLEEEQQSRFSTRSVAARNAGQRHPATRTTIRGDIDVTRRPGIEFSSPPPYQRRAIHEQVVLQEANAYTNYDARTVQSRDNYKAFVRRFNAPEEMPPGSDCTLRQPPTTIRSRTRRTSNHGSASLHLKRKGTMSRKPDAGANSFDAVRANGLRQSSSVERERKAFTPPAVSLSPRRPLQSPGQMSPSRFNQQDSPVDQTTKKIGVHETKRTTGVAHNGETSGLHQYNTSTNTTTQQQAASTVLTPADLMLSRTQSRNQLLSSPSPSPRGQPSPKAPAPREWWADHKSVKCGPLRVGLRQDAYRQCVREKRQQRSAELLSAMTSPSDDLLVEKNAFRHIVARLYQPHRRARSASPTLVGGKKKHLQSAGGARSTSSPSNQRIKHEGEELGAPQSPTQDPHHDSSRSPGTSRSLSNRRQRLELEMKLQNGTCLYARGKAARERKDFERSTILAERALAETAACTFQPDVFVSQLQERQKENARLIEWAQERWASAVEGSHTSSSSVQLGAHKKPTSQPIATPRGHAAAAIYLNQKSALLQRDSSKGKEVPSTVLGDRNKISSTNSGGGGNSTNSGTTSGNNIAVTIRGGGGVGRRPESEQLQSLPKRLTSTVTFVDPSSAGAAGRVVGVQQAATSTNSSTSAGISKKSLLKNSFSPSLGFVSANSSNCEMNRASTSQRTPRMFSATSADHGFASLQETSMQVDTRNNDTRNIAQESPAALVRKMERILNRGAGRSISPQTRAKQRPRAVDVLRLSNRDSTPATATVDLTSDADEQIEEEIKKSSGRTPAAGPSSTSAGKNNMVRFLAGERKDNIKNAKNHRSPSPTSSSRKNNKTPETTSSSRRASSSSAQRERLARQRELSLACPPRFAAPLRRTPRWCRGGGQREQSRSPNIGPRPSSAPPRQQITWDRQQMEERRQERLYEKVYEMLAGKKSVKTRAELKNASSSAFTYNKTSTHSTSSRSRQLQKQYEKSGGLTNEQLGNSVIVGVQSTSDAFGTVANDFNPGGRTNATSSITDSRNNNKNTDSGVHMYFYPAESSDGGAGSSSRNNISSAFTSMSAASSRDYFDVESCNPRITSISSNQEQRAAASRPQRAQSSATKDDSEYVFHHWIPSTAELLYSNRSGADIVVIKEEEEEDEGDDLQAKQDTRAATATARGRQIHVGDQAEDGHRGPEKKHFSQSSKGTSTTSMSSVSTPGTTIEEIEHRLSQAREQAASGKFSFSSCAKDETDID
ncbi:unnamed protein product [Amoebophrya sp. A25]|nr:unnamed protein product [Amoebophrya sp. A25]|eukprot:GSA25T00003858001.1